MTTLLAYHRPQAPAGRDPSESRFAPDGTPVMCQPGHWAYHTHVPWYMADALDQIAADVGLPDGLSVLAKAASRDPDDLATASRAELRAWWDECYAWAGHRTSRGYTGSYWDVVMYGSTGIFQIGAGAGEMHNVEGASRPPGRMMPGGPSR